MDIPEGAWIPTTAEQLQHNIKLINYTLAQANADGRPLVELFRNGEWCGDVCARFAIHETEIEGDDYDKWMNTLVEFIEDNVRE